MMRSSQTQNTDQANPLKLRYQLPHQLPTHSGRVPGALSLPASLAIANLTLKLFKVGLLFLIFIFPGLGTVLGKQ